MSTPPHKIDIEKHKLNADFEDERTVEFTIAENGEKTIQRIWERGRSLGGGAFAEVWQEKREDEFGDWDYRAIKVCPKRRLVYLKIDYKRELAAFVALSSSEYAKLFVHFYGWWEDRRDIFFVMEYLKRGDLSSYLSNGLTEDDARDIITDVATGIKVLHLMGFTHRDIKPQNILIVQKRPEFSRWSVKIGDFGISKRIYEDSHTYMQTNIGTQSYRAPETFPYLIQSRESSVYDNKVDLWSLGCVLFAIGSRGHTPFSEVDLLKYCDGSTTFNPQGRELFLQQSGVSLICALLDPSPQTRLSASDVLNHEWLTRALNTGSLHPSSPKKTLIDRKDSNEEVIKNLTSGSLQEKPATPNKSFNTSREGNHPHQSDRGIADGKASITNRNETPQIDKPDTQWAQIRESAESAAQSKRDATAEGTDEIAAGESSEEETIETRVARIKARVAELTSNISEKATPQPLLTVAKSRSSGRLAESTSTIPPDITIFEAPRTTRSLSPNSTNMLMSRPVSSIKSETQKNTENVTKHRSIGPTKEQYNAYLIAKQLSEKTMLTDHSDNVVFVAFLLGEYLMLSVSRQGEIRLWNTKTWKSWIAAQTEKGVGPIAIAPYGKYQVYTKRVAMFATAPKHDLSVFHVESSFLRRASLVQKKDFRTKDEYGSSFYSRIASLAISPDSRYVAIGFYDGVIELRSLELLGGDVYLRSQCEYPATSLVFSPNTSFLASICYKDKDILLWHLKQLNQSKLLTGHTDNVQAIAFSRDGFILASASLDKTVRLWHGTSGSLFRVCDCSQGGLVHALAFSFNSMWLALGRSNDRVEIWKGDTGLVDTVLNGRSGNDVLAVAFSPTENGLLVAASSKSKDIARWNTNLQTI